jgi:hypothetical protein
MPRFEVVVGNIGTVYNGPDKEQAQRDFRHYKELSESGHGRAAEEEVSLFEDGVLLDIHCPVEMA